MAGSAPDPHVTQPHFPVVVTHRSLTSTLPRSKLFRRASSSTRQYGSSHGADSGWGLCRAQVGDR